MLAFSSQCEEVFGDTEHTGFHLWYDDGGNGVERCTKHTHVGEAKDPRHSIQGAMSVIRKKADQQLSACGVAFKRIKLHK